MKTLLTQRQIELAIACELQAGDRTLEQLSQGIGDGSAPVCMAIVSLLEEEAISQKFANGTVTYSANKSASNR